MDSPLGNMNIHSRFHCNYQWMDIVPLCCCLVTFILSASCLRQLVIRWLCDYLSSKCLLFVCKCHWRARCLSMILHLFIAAAKKGKPTLLLHYSSPVNIFPASRCSQTRRLSQKIEAKQGREWNIFSSDTFEDRLELKARPALCLPGRAWIYHPLRLRWYTMSTLVFSSLFCGEAIRWH